MDKMLHILCATDDNYAQHCGALISSIFNNSNHNITIHIIESNLSEVNKENLNFIASTYNQRIIYYNFNSRNIENFTQGQCAAKSLVTYYRIFISSIITDIGIKKILYLDCDIIVNRDISSLFNLDMRNYPIAAVQDLKNPIKEEHRLNLSFGYREKYFNAGVILINLEQWRINNYESQLLDFLHNDSLGYFADQDALNFVFKDNWLELSPYWNRFNLIEYNNIYFKTKNDELSYIYNPIIIHYASPYARPWLGVKFIPYYKEYQYYLDRTPWKNSKIPNLYSTKIYRIILSVKWSNFLYRSPLLIRILITSIYDILIFVYHLIRHRSLKYYSPYKI